MHTISDLVPDLPMAIATVKRDIAHEIMHMIYTDQRALFRDTLMEIMLMSHEPKLVEAHAKLLKLAETL